MEVYGDRHSDALVYLHGGPGASCLDFVNQAKALGEKLKVIIFDQLGVLRSDAIAENEDYSMEYQIEMIEEMRGKLGIEKWSVLGHSYGGLRRRTNIPVQSWSSWKAMEQCKIEGGKYIGYGLGFT